MKKISSIVALLSIVALVGCAPPIKANLKNNAAVKKVAVVSMAISDWGGTVTANSVGRNNVGELMQQATSTMITYTEKELARHWQVKPVASFINDAKYRKAAADVRVSTYSPVIRGKEMPLFGAGFKRGDITPAKAQELCADLHVDAVVLVFSEWTARTGGFIPLTKALSKNVVSVWDKQGKKIYYRRIDVMGKKTLGAMGIHAVNEGTIDQWTGGYETALQRMFARL